MGPTKRAPTGPRQRRLPTREGARVTSISLTEDQHRRALLAAMQRRQTMTQIFREALDEWLARHDGRRA